LLTLMQTRLAHQIVRTVGLFALGLSAVQCSDRATLDPNATPTQARLSIQPQFTRAPGAPTVTLSHVRASLVGPNRDSSVTDAPFQNASAALQFQIAFFGGPTEFLLTVEAFDTQNLLVYRFSKKITIVPGRTTTVAQPTLEYVAADAAVTKLVFSPSALQLNAGASGEFSVAGMNSGGQPISPVRLAFTSKDPSIATVDPNTGAVTAGAFQGSTYIIAHTVTGVADSALVKVHAPVDKVTLAPATLSIVRGNSAAVAAELRDAGNHLIDDRSATFSSGDSTIATVTQSGVVKGVAIGKTTITASAEGKTATTVVTVISPVDHLEITPQNIQLASVGETVPLVVKVVPVAGASVDGLAATFSSSNPAVATVDSKGVVKALANGTTSITVDVDGVESSTLVTVKQVVAGVSVSPRVASVNAIGATQTFAALAVDALGNPVKAVQVQWTTSDPHVATVDPNGTVTAHGAGTATISATIDGKTDTVTFIVAPVVSLLIVSSDKTQIAVGQTATLSAKFADAGGTVIRDAAAVFTNTTPNVASLSGNVLTGLSAGTAHITATVGGLSGSIDIKVTGVGGGGQLTITPSSAEKLPNGTQAFAATGGSGTYDWSVNGVPGGNSTFGTISTTGFYRAPGAVPTPSTFDVCATDHANPTVQGCAHVTISPVPTSGGDVIVFNDINMFQDGTGSNTPGNVQLFKNLVTYTGEGPRAAQKTVWVHRGHNMYCDVCFNQPGSWAFFESTMAAQGYTVQDVDDESGPLTNIPPNVKLIILTLPQTSYSVDEINSLKNFSKDGGRILFVGEWDGYYGAGIGVENDFLSKMGAVMRNLAGDVSCPELIKNIAPHQVTTGTTSGIEVACVSVIQLGPNDYALLTNAAGQIIGGVAKVDLTPLPTDAAPLRASRVVKPATRLSQPAAGVHSWGMDASPAARATVTPIRPPDP